MAEVQGITPTETSSFVSEYTIIKRLGSGKQAEVFLAQDRLGRKVAIKRGYCLQQMKGFYPQEFLPVLFECDGTYRGAKEEFRIGKQLHNHAIIQLHEFYIAPDEEGRLRSHIVMKYVDGQPLDEVSAGTCTKNEAIKNARRLLKALAHAYGQRLIHEDLYSSNLMLDKHHRLKLIDLESFGDIRTEGLSERVKHRLSEELEYCREVLEKADFKEEDISRIVRKIKSATLKNPALADDLRSRISEKSADLCRHVLLLAARILKRYLTVFDPPSTSPQNALARKPPALLP